MCAYLVCFVAPRRTLFARGLRLVAQRGGEASGGVCLVSFLWARVDSAVLRHNLILLGSK